MNKANHRYIGLGLLFGILVGCQSSAPKPASAPVKAPVVAPAQKPVVTREQQIKRLLADADYALSQNRLLMPLEDNAHDRYHAVLLLDPKNSGARTGLQAITLRYIELARSATARSQYSQAQSYLNQARDLEPGNPLVQEFAAVLRKEIANQKPAQSYKPGANEHLLDARELSQQSPAVIEQLTALAQVAKASGDLVMIHARNDAEGRWIYQQMRNALPGFLLRGDIKIAKQPRVQFVPLQQ